MKNWLWQILIAAAALLLVSQAGFPFGGAPSKPQKCILSLLPNKTPQGVSEKIYTGYGRTTQEATTDAVANCRIEMDVVDLSACGESAAHNKGDHPNLICGDTPDISHTPEPPHSAEPQHLPEPVHSPVPPLPIQ